MCDLYLATGVPGVRLIGEDPGAGRVEVNVSGSWHTVCDDGWSTAETDVVCKQLNYTGATYFTTGPMTVKMFGIPDRNQSIIIGDIGCDGHEATVFECPGFDPDAPTTCFTDHAKDVGVICYCMLHLL